MTHPSSPDFAATPFHVMAKPIGPICNLDCRYCYYLHKEELYPNDNKWKIGDECLESYIRQYMDAQPNTSGEVTFAWQGGEPTLMGVDFFQRCIDLQQQHAKPGQTITNSIQTNGIQLDDEWCLFLRRNRFLVGLSIDGPANLHDAYRVDHQGKGSHSAVITALRKLKKFNVDFNALVTVHAANCGHGRRIYEYLRDSGCGFLQFIPIVERKGIGRHSEGEVDDNFTPFSQAADSVSSRSVPPDLFGSFLCDVFDAWVQQDVGRVYVQIFDQSLSAWLGIEPSLCVFKKQCGRAIAMEHNGDVYSCDHFVDSDHLLGNLTVIPLTDLVNSQQQQTFGQNKETTLPSYCKSCDVRFACNGECPKNRFLQTPDGEDGLNYLCAGYKKFFKHIDKPMKKMADLIKSNQSPALVMQDPAFQTNRS